MDFLLVFHVKGVDLALLAVALVDCGDPHDDKA
jgi:hypothetical protein